MKMYMKPTQTHTETQRVFLAQDVNIWQLRSISCKHVESVCLTEGISVGSQSAMWRCNSLMKNMCGRAWVHVCVWVRKVLRVHVPEHYCFQSVWHCCRACYGLQKQSYLCGGENCKGPIKCAGYHSRHPNICDLCIKQTRKASGEKIRKLHFSPPSHLMNELRQSWTLEKELGLKVWVRSFQARRSQKTVKIQFLQTSCLLEKM